MEGVEEIPNLHNNGNRARLEENKEESKIGPLVPPLVSFTHKVTIGEITDELVAQSVWIQGYVVFHKKRKLMLDDSTGLAVVMWNENLVVDQLHAEQHPKLGTYLAVLGTVRLTKQTASVYLRPLQILNLSKDPNRESLWLVERACLGVHQLQQQQQLLQEQEQQEQQL